MNDTTCPNTTADAEKPRIYVASLADYNAGRLHGRWIDACQDAEAIRNEIHEMLKASPEPVAEDWAIHDHENFGPVQLSEWESIDTVAELAALLEEHGSVFGALVTHFGGTDNLDEAKQAMTEGYRGAYRTLEDYAEELAEECYSDALKRLPDFLRYRIDWEGVARDLELSGDVFTVECDGLVHVFDGHY